MRTRRRKREKKQTPRGGREQAYLCYVELLSQRGEHPHPVSRLCLSRPSFRLSSFTRRPSWARHDREWHGMALIARLHRAWVGETWTASADERVQCCPRVR